MNKNNIVEGDIKQITASIKKLAHSLEGKTILITGGAGFLGRYMVNTLVYLNKDILKKRCKVISLDNYMIFPKKKFLSKTKIEGVKYIRHDITKSLTLHGKVDYIIHAAGIAAPVLYQKYPLETIDVAVTGTRNMLELARKKRVKSFLYFSSSEIYGNPVAEAIPTKETYKGNVSCIGPRACYDESKRLGETICFTYFRLYQTPIKVVRPFNIFGPGMAKDYRVMPSFIYNALNNQPLPVHVSGKQTRTFCYISDAVSAFFKVLLSNKNGEVYNVGNNVDEINMNQLASIINKIFNNKLKIKNIEYPKNYPADEPQRRCPDLSKIKKEIGFKTTVSLENALKRTIAWCKENWI